MGDSKSDSALSEITPPLILFTTFVVDVDLTAGFFTPGFASDDLTLIIFPLENDTLPPHRLASSVSVRDINIEKI